MMDKHFWSIVIGLVGTTFALAAAVAVDGYVQWGFSYDYMVPVDAESALLLQFRDGWVGMCGLVTVLVLSERYQVRAVVRLAMVVVIAFLYGASTFFRYSNSTCASIEFFRLSTEEQQSTCHVDPQPWPVQRSLLPRRSALSQLGVRQSQWTAVAGACRIEGPVTI